MSAHYLLYNIDKVLPFDVSVSEYLLLLVLDDFQANDARKELYEKETEINKLKQDVLGLQQDLKHANEQCVLLFNEVQKAWRVSFTLQSDLKVWIISLMVSYISSICIIFGPPEGEREISYLWRPNYFLVALCKAQEIIFYKMKIKQERMMCNVNGC